MQRAHREHRDLDLREIGAAQLPEVVVRGMVDDVPDEVPAPHVRVLRLGVEASRDAQPVVAADLPHVPGGGEADGHHAAVPGDVAVHVGARVPGEDAGQVRGLLTGGEPLHPGEQRLAQHADLAGAPVLGGDPLDHVVEVGLLLLAPEGPLPLRRVAGAARVGVHEDVAAADEVLDVVDLDAVEDGQRRDHVDHVLLVRVGGVQRRERALGVRPVDVGGDHHPVAHGDHDVLLDHHAVPGLTQLVRREVRRQHRAHDLRVKRLAVHQTAPCARVPSWR